MSMKAQPPPRKVKLSNHLKTLHSEQLMKLHLKHQQDTELLDDIRNFTKIRAQIEKDYGSAMVKLATTYLAKKPPPGIDYKTEDRADIKSVFGVWRMLLDESEKIGKARLASANVFQSRISENAKNTRQAKLQIAKRCFDSLRKYQEEVQQTVLEVDKTRKLYFEEEHMAHDARGKAHDVEEKLKKKKGGIFSSISSLQKKNDKFSSRREACDIQSTKARNDYILALAAANAHQKRYYDTDLRDILENLDCDISEKVREYLVLMSRTELLTVAACNSSFVRIQEEASKITKQYSIDQYLVDNPTLGVKVDYEFDACDDDEIRTICTDHLAEHALQKDAKRWASAYMKECRVLRDSNRELNKLLNKRDKGEKTVENVSGESEDIDSKIEEYKNIIRRAETGLVKADARLNALRAGAVNVDEYLSSLDIDSLQIEELTRKGSMASRRSFEGREAEERPESQSSEAAEEVGQRDSYDEDAQPDNRNSSQSYEDYEEQDYRQDDYHECDQVEPQTSYEDPTAVDWGETEAATADATAAPPTTEQPQSYGASSTDYSSGAWNQQDEVQDSGDWNTGQLSAGCRCIAIYTYEAANEDELSFVENEELECVHEGDGDGWIRARNSQRQEGYIPANYVQLSTENQGEPLTMGESFGAVAYEETAAYVLPPSSLPGSLAPAAQELEQQEKQQPYCRALYDYESTCEDELTFFEGDVIRIVSKLGSDGVDDGWWTGEFNGKIGTFPSLVVEEVKHTGEAQTPVTPMIQTPEGLPPPPNFEPPKPVQTPNDVEPEFPLGDMKEAGPSPGPPPLPPPPAPVPTSTVNIVIDSPDEPPREFFDSFDEEEPQTTIERKPSTATADKGESNQVEDKEQQKKDEDEKEQAEEEKKDEEKTLDRDSSPSESKPAISYPQPQQPPSGEFIDGSDADQNLADNIDDDNDRSLSSARPITAPAAPQGDSSQEVPMETGEDVQAPPDFPPPPPPPPPPAPETDSPSEGDLC